MEGWPEGWKCYEVAESDRIGCIKGRYVLVGEREGCRRAAWAIEGGPTIDREELARALHEAGALGPWAEVCEGTRAGYRAMADEAIRLIGFDAGVDRLEALTKIEKLEREHAALQERLTSAVARAEEAQARIEGLKRTNAVLQEQVEAQTQRAQKAEEERDVLRDYDSPFEQDAEDLRAEVQRLQSVLARTAQAAARLADALSAMAGGEDA